jgi:hypothetical protein
VSQQCATSMSVRPAEQKLCTKQEIEVAIDTLLAGYDAELTADSACAHVMADLHSKTEPEWLSALQKCAIEAANTRFGGKVPQEVLEPDLEAPEAPPVSPPDASTEAPPDASTEAPSDASTEAPPDASSPEAELSTSVATTEGKVPQQLGGIEDDIPPQPDGVEEADVSKEDVSSSISTQISAQSVLELNTKLDFLIASTHARIDSLESALRWLKPIGDSKENTATLETHEKVLGEMFLTKRSVSSYTNHPILVQATAAVAADASPNR